MRKINLIVVHCTATPATRTVTAADVDNWHKARGFQCIGYHYLIHQNGYIELGRDIEQPGAHTKGFNSYSVGVAYVGGVDSEGKPADARTPEQKSALRRLLVHLKESYPDASIHSHRDFANKACPCFDATKEYEDI